MKLTEMGRYMKKAKLAGDVAVMDISQSSLGVRTRAKTLALQRLQSSSASLSSMPYLCYLELRSRRLEKPPLLRQYMQNSQKVSSPKPCFNCREKEGFGIESVSKKARSDSDLKSGSIGLTKEDDGCLERRSSRGFESGDSEIEASFGENNLESEAWERGTRESTPCSLIRAADTITTPGSTTKMTSLTVANQRASNTRLRNMPTSAELEDFFTHAEQSRQRLFMEKYNFDIVNDLPLPGRYEWVKLSP